MWICTNRGFLSILDNAEQADCLTVASRRAEDLEATFPEYAHCVVRVPNAEFMFQAQLPRHIVAAEIAEYIASIDYSEFPMSGELSTQAYRPAVA